MYVSTFMHIYNAKRMKNNGCIHLCIKTKLPVPAGVADRISDNYSLFHPLDQSSTGQEIPSVVLEQSRTQHKVLVLPMFLGHYIPHSVMRNNYI